MSTNAAEHLVEIFNHIETTRPEENTPINLAATAATLQQRLTALQQENHFYEGQLIQWKQGFQNRRASGVFIVSEVFNKPLLSSTDESCSAYFRETLDIKIMLLDHDGDIDELHVDSRRFEPYDGPTLDTLESDADLSAEDAR